MRKLRTLRGRAIPLLRADVDTDQIIPARHLKCIERSGLGRFAFEAWRKDPAFVLNDEAYHDAPILIAGPNFGCGSSREHAPWALLDMGIQAIIAPSFADIFAGNCARVGLLTIVLEEQECQRLGEMACNEPGSELEVSVEEQTVTTDDRRTTLHFRMDPFVKHCLMEGLDTIALTLQNARAIATFETRRPLFFPKTKGD
jgi:3-isopropylmalate/(R)-2-methylmalate dehydratase small subunit